MNTSFLRGALILVMATGATAAQAGVRAKLTGYEEVPSVSTDATGRFRAQLNRSGDGLKYKLSYAGIESLLRFAHIHFARRGANGDVIVFLCDNTGGAPADTPYCPEGSGTVEGEIRGEHVLGPTAQGIEPGDFEALVDAINARAAYINVHSEKFKTGELRGQVWGRLFSRGDYDQDDEKEYDKEDDTDDRDDD